MVAETASAMISRVVGSSRGVRPTVSGCHQRFQGRPDQLELRRVDGDDPPEGRDEVEILGLLDVGEDGGDLAGRLALLDRTDGGVIVAPAAAIDRLRVVKQNTDLHTDQLAQGCLAEFLRRGWFTKHVAKMRKVYALATGGAG